MNADKKMCGMNPDSQYVELAVEIFGLLADIVDKSPAAVSQDLARLRMARIVSTRQEGQRVFYKLTNEHALRLVSDAIFQAEHTIADGQTPPHHHRDRES